MALNLRAIQRLNRRQRQRELQRELQRETEAEFALLEAEHGELPTTPVVEFEVVNVEFEEASEFEEAYSPRSRPIKFPTGRVKVGGG